MEDWLITVVLAALEVTLNIVLAAIATVGTKGPPRTDSDSGELILEYGGGAKALAIVLGAFPLPIVLGAVLTDFSTFEAEARAWLVVVGLFFLFSLPFTIELFGVSHRLTNEGIRKGSPWSRKFFVRWEEFSSVKYSGVYEGYVVRTGKGTIRLSSYLRGIAEFRIRMAQHELRALDSKLALGVITTSEYLQGREQLEQLYGRS
jgi:hypothetical protein